MKFLIIQKVRKDFPVEKWAKLLPLEFKYFDRLEEEGILEVCYHLIGAQGSMLVVNVESDMELSRVVGEDPMFFYTEREIYPLTTRQSHENRLMKMLQP
jgi:muconolactone delta-isomerase